MVLVADTNRTMVAICWTQNTGCIFAPFLFPAEEFGLGG